MARAQALDFMNNARFHVFLAAGPDVAHMGGQLDGGVPQAGFNSVTLPTLSADSVEYKEGHNIYTKKFPGIPSVDDITLNRGVTRGDSSFWNWIRVVAEGSGEYRANIEIKQYHRDTALVREFPTSGAQANLTNINLDRPAKTYKVFECFPTSCKPNGDFDATSADISIMEMTLACEFYEVEEHDL